MGTDGAVHGVKARTHLSATRDLRQIRMLGSVRRCIVSDMPLRSVATVLGVAFLEQHPAAVGLACWFLIIAWAWKASKRPYALPAPRDRHARALYRAFEVVAFLTLAPLLLTVMGEKFGGGVTRSGRHFEYVMLLTAIGMACVAAIIYWVWRLLADSMVRRAAAMSKDRPTP